MLENDLQPVEYSSQRILTTQQIAEFYGTDTLRIQQNYNNNKDRYIPGKHYFVLEGEELKTFLSLHLEIFEVQNINKIRLLYLWTEKGALMHAKSLNTDLAWEKYDWLVDDYYRKIERLTISEQQFAEARAMIKTLTDNPQKLPWGLSYAELGDCSMAIPRIYRCIGDINALLARSRLTEKQTQKLQDTLAELDKHVAATQAALYQDLETNRHIDDLFFKMKAIAHHLALPDPNSKSE